MCFGFFLIRMHLTEMHSEINKDKASSEWFPPSFQELTEELTQPEVKQTQEEVSGWFICPVWSIKKKGTQQCDCRC